MKKPVTTKRKRFPALKKAQAALDEIIQRNSAVIDAQIAATPPRNTSNNAAASGVCVIFFDDGRTACSAKRGSLGACDDWGAWWRDQGHPNTPQVVSKCPPGSKEFP